MLRTKVWIGKLKELTPTNYLRETLSVALNNYEDSENEEQEIFAIGVRRRYLHFGIYISYLKTLVKDPFFKSSKFWCIKTISSIPIWV